MASPGPPRPSDYIAHHLTNLNTSGKAQTAMFDLSIVNLDTVFFATLTGILGLWWMWSVAKKATYGAPGRSQAALEWLVEMVDNRAKKIIPNAGSRKFVAPVGLLVFIWVILMNSMDFLPIDLLPTLWQLAWRDPGAYLKVVPTTDLSATLGLSGGVLIICIWYTVKIKGIKGLVSSPFGNLPLLYLPNFVMQMIEFLAKAFSHGMRLWGNMYAGELIFMLIALMGMYAPTLSLLSGSSLVLGHVVAGSAWAIFHILIIVLQAYIFMMLALVYIGQAHEHH